MARTGLTSDEITNVQRNDFDTTTTGQAVITKVIAGTGISLSSTGVDAGTGDVTITDSFGTGLSGGQTLIGSTSTNSGLTVKATTGVGTTSADIIFQVGNNGATEALRILNSGYVGFGTTSAASRITIKESANGAGLRIQNSSGSLGDLILATETANGGIFWNIKSSNRVNIEGSQLYFVSSGGIFFQGSNGGFNRTGDSSSIATQKNSYATYWETALFISSSNTYRYAGVQAEASTSVAGAFSLAGYIGTNDPLSLTANGALEMFRYSSTGKVTLNKSPVAYTGGGLVNNTTTLSTVTNCTFTTVANITYHVRVLCTFDSAAITTGIRLVLTTAGTIVAMFSRVDGTATASTRDIQDGNSGNSTPATASAAALTTNNTRVYEGFLKLSTATAVNLQFASEVATSAITITYAVMHFYALD